MYHLLFNKKIFNYNKMYTSLKNKRNQSKLTLKETFMMKDPKMLKAYSKIIPERFTEKKDIKKNKDKLFFKK